MPPKEEPLYENMSEYDLGVRCITRKIRYTSSNKKIDHIRILIEADRSAFLAKTKIFNEFNDPTGAQSEAYIRLHTKMEKQWARSIANAIIQKDERALQITTERIRQRKGELEKEIDVLGKKEKTALADVSRRVRESEEKEKKKAAAATDIQKQAGGESKSSKLSETTPVTGTPTTPISVDSDTESTPQDGPPPKKKAASNGPPCLPASSSWTAHDESNMASGSRRHHPSNHKRGAPDANHLDTVPTPHKRSKVAESLAAAPRDLIEPGRGLILRELLEQKQSFLRIKGPLILNVEQVEGFRQDAAKYNPIAVRADKSHIYIIFDPTAPNYLELERHSDRQKCMSSLDVIIQSSSRNRDNLPFKEIDEMSSFYKGVLRKQDYSMAPFHWEKQWS